MELVVSGPPAGPGRAAERGTAGPAELPPGWPGPGSRRGSSDAPCGPGGEAIAGGGGAPGLAAPGAGPGLGGGAGAPPARHNSFHEAIGRLADLDSDSPA